MQGREVLKKGAQWCAGNGEDISIWGDAWLPSLEASRINNPMGIDFPEIQVSSLIKPHTRSWKVELLQALFSLEEANLIRSIPLGNAMAGDKVIWLHAQFGVYSIESGYYLLSKERTLGKSKASNPELTQKIWKFIWSLSVSNKVRNFMWRAAKNAILVKDNLVERKVPSKATSNHCK